MQGQWFICSCLPLPPQALSQCDRYLRGLPNRRGVREAVFDTAGAAQDIARNQLR
jgi:prephenate dehydratase